MKLFLKSFILLQSALVFVNISSAQNFFPVTGNVGIGTVTAPNTLLDIGPGTVPAFVPNNASISGLQAKSINATTNNLFLSSFYAEQQVANNASVEAAQFYTVSSHPSGNIARVIPIFVYHLFSGAGTIGEVRMVQSAAAMNGGGTVTNWYSFLGNSNNSGAGSITNGYGLYIQPFGGNITNKYGVYVNDATANNYFGGTLCIGTTNPQGYSLAVNGPAIFTKAVVKIHANWPDYVFDPAYKLPSLQSVERFIQQHHHLPGLPATRQTMDKGIDLGENQALLLKKVEELTLYAISQQKRVEALEEENKKLKDLRRQVEELKLLITKKERP